MTDTATLQARLTDAEAAYHALMLGGKAVTLSYSQGNGTKAVTYTPADAARLAGYIASLQRQIGLTSRRRSIGVFF